MHTWKLEQLLDLNYRIKESLLSCLMILLVFGKLSTFFDFIQSIYVLDYCHCFFQSDPL